MAELEIVQLVKRYGTQLVVDHLDLTVRDGEFMTLLGPSGCGKTTTLRAIAGLVEIDEGSIYFGGRLMNDVPPHKRSFAMVFQSYALFPHMSVRQNIGFGLRMRHVAAAERARRVDEAMALVNLEALADRRPANLSGGQQQRVALARAIVTQPDILLFDEPLSNLDAKLRERLRIEIRGLQRRLGITTIYVTHDQAEALVMSDRIIVMNHGRIEQAGDPLSIYRQPATTFTAEFIGQVNIVEGSLVATDPGGSVVETRIGRLKTTSRPASKQSPVSVVWRPEDLVPYAEGMANRIEATVTEAIFMGNLTDLFLDANGVTLRAQRSGAFASRVGDRIVVGLPEESIWILP